MNSVFFVNKILILFLTAQLLKCEVLYFGKNGQESNKNTHVEEQTKDKIINEEQSSHLPLSSLFAQSSKYQCLKDDASCHHSATVKETMGPRFQKVHLALPKREFKEVGYQENITVNGRVMTLTTRSRTPYIVEISNFLSVNETELMIEMAENRGLKQRDVRPIQVYVPTEITQVLFDHWDLDFDGHLSVEEIYSILELNPLTMSRTDVKIMIEQTNIDKDNNGYLSYAELSKGGLKNMTSYLQEREVERAYIKSHHVMETWLWHDEDELLMYEDLLEDYHERISSITDIPISIIEQSEPIKVRHNKEGSYCYCQEDSKSWNHNSPCCSYGDENCKTCRYATVMMFLNDVESGGEVLFPFADNETFSWVNLKEDFLNKCEPFPNKNVTNLVITPKRGSALLYYNHDVSPQTGWMSEALPQSVSGSTQIIKGDRWIGKMWINIIGDGVNDLRPWKMGSNWLSGNNLNKDIIEEMRNDYFREGETYSHEYRKSYKRTFSNDSDNKDVVIEVGNNKDAVMEIDTDTSINEGKTLNSSASETIEKQNKSAPIEALASPSNIEIKKNSEEKLKETIEPIKPKPDALNIPLTSMSMMQGLKKDKTIKSETNEHGKRTEVPLGPPKLPAMGNKMIENRLVKASLLLMEELERDELEIIARSLHDKLQLACIPLIVNPINI